MYVTKGLDASPTYKFSSRFARQQRASTFLHGEYLRVTITKKLWAAPDVLVCDPCKRGLICDAVGFCGANLIKSVYWQLLPYKVIQSSN